MRAYKHLKELLSGEINIFIARFMPLLIHRALKRDLHAVWAQGDWQSLPDGGLLLAANHHSWWDGYLMWLIAQKKKRHISGFMEESQLRRFRFFRHLGMLGKLELREALRRLKRGDLFFIFPEGELCQAGRLKQVYPGMAFLAQRSTAPVFPLVLRVVMRGAQIPRGVYLFGSTVAKLQGC